MVKNVIKAAQIKENQFVAVWIWKYDMECAYIICREILANISWCQSVNNIIHFNRKVSCPKIKT